MRKNYGSAAIACAIALSGALGSLQARAQVADEDRVLVAASRQAATLVPDVSAVDLRGRTWSLRSLRGRPIILSICATWCPASREQMLDLERLQKKFGRRGLLILAVSSEDSGRLADYARSSGLSVPLLSDAGGAMSDAMGAPAFPTAFFIGRDSRVLARTVGSGSGVARLFSTLAQAELAPVASSQARSASSASSASSKARRGAKARQRKGRTASKARAKDDGVVLLSNSGRRVIR